jgi:ATP synthase protein I
MMDSGKQNKQDFFSHAVAEKANRKLTAQSRNPYNVWSGFALFGIVGWSIVFPTLLGTILGVWLDKNYGQSFSWTISFLLMGLVVGCIVAWKWVVKENKEIHQKNETDE